MKITGRFYEFLCHSPTSRNCPFLSMRFPIIVHVIIKFRLHTPFHGRNLFGRGSWQTFLKRQEVAPRSEVGFLAASKRRHYELSRFPDHLVFAYAQAENKQRENVPAMGDARAKRHTRSRWKKRVLVKGIKGYDVNIGRTTIWKNVAT